MTAPFPYFFQFILVFLPVTTVNINCHQYFLYYICCYQMWQAFVKYPSIEQLNPSKYHHWKKPNSFSKNLTFSTPFYHWRNIPEILYSSTEIQPHVLRLYFNSLHFSLYPAGKSHFNYPVWYIRDKQRYQYHNHKNYYFENNRLVSCNYFIYRRSKIFN